MALIPPKYLQSVVAMGLMASPERLIAPHQSMSQIATGFLYAYPRSGLSNDSRDSFKLWLITCKHVIQQADVKSNEIFARLNKSEHSGMQTFRISLQRGDGPDWTLHPTADVAVIPASWQDLEAKGVRWETFAAGRNALSRTRAAEVGLTEGDEVFIVGFPAGWMEGRQDYPIVRHGVLAQIQGWLKEEHDTFLVDGSGFPGNSGGPVLTKPQRFAVVGTQAVGESWLIGMVSERKLSRICTDARDVAETADLVQVIPVDFIDETIRIAMQEEGSE